MLDERDADFANIVSDAIVSAIRPVDPMELLLESMFAEAEAARAGGTGAGGEPTDDPPTLALQITLVETSIMLGTGKQLVGGTLAGGVRRHRDHTGAVVPGVYQILLPGMQAGKERLMMLFFCARSVLHVGVMVDESKIVKPSGIIVPH